MESRSFTYKERGLGGRGGGWLDMKEKIKIDCYLCPNQFVENISDTSSSTHFIFHNGFIFCFFLNSTVSDEFSSWDYHNLYPVYGL